MRHKQIDRGNVAVGLAAWCCELHYTTYMFASLTATQIKASEIPGVLIKSKLYQVNLFHI